MIVGCSINATPDVPKHISSLENLTVYSLPENPDTILLSATQKFTSTNTILLNSVSDMAVDAAGTVYIGDSDQNAIQVYTPDGEHETTIGGEGNGPGEFRRINEVHVTDEKLYAYDSGNFRINIYSLESQEYVDQINIDPKNIQHISELSGMLTLVNFWPLNNNTFLVALGEMNSIDDRVIYYYKLDREGQIISKKILEQENVNMYLIDDIKVSLALPFARKPLFCLSSGKYFYSARTGEFVIKRFTTTGKYQGAFYYPYQNEPLNKAEFLDQYPHGPFRKGLSKAEYPETWPSLNNMLCGDQNRLWISTITANEQVYQWWVLNEYGELLGRFDWARKNEIRVIRNGYLYTIETDRETDLNEIIKYKINISG